jgi:ATP-binding cassette subfamily C (CFTR/MRP) protein 1
MPPASITMTEPGGEKEHKPADPIVGTGTSTTSSPEHLTKEDDQDYIEKSESRDGSSSSRDGEAEGKAEKKEQLKTTQSHATTASGLSRTESNVVEAKPKPWHKKLNPLRWGGAPPVPTEKTVSREYGASFFSLITFQWMAPLMHVSFDFSWKLGLYVGTD